MHNCSHWDSYLYRKKRLKTANKIVPNPKPEKNVNNEPINAERIIITNAKPKYDFVRTNIRLT